MGPGGKMTSSDHCQWFEGGFIKELSPTSYSFKMEMQGSDGKWAPMMESTNTKVK
jgi:hypothetical protein